MESDFDRSTKAQAEVQAVGPYPATLRMGFIRGRDSAKPSLEILARALDHIMNDCQCETDDRDVCFGIAVKAIAEVKARGDWPLEEK